MKVMVVGNQEAVRGFSLAGVGGIVANTAEEADEALNQALALGDLGIILVTQDISKLIEPRMDQLKLRSTVPLVVEIPGPEGVSADTPTLGDVVLRAIGIKI